MSTSLAFEICLGYGNTDAVWAHFERESKFPEILHGRLYCEWRFWGNSWVYLFGYGVLDSGANTKQPGLRIRKSPPSYVDMVRGSSRSTGTNVTGSPQSTRIEKTLPRDNGVPHGFTSCGFVCHGITADATVQWHLEGVQKH